MFRQDKKHIANFMIKFKALAIKAETDVIHTIFLLKKNVWINIIKTILGYLLVAVPKVLREWKVVITLVGQEYESTESQQDYRTDIGITYRERSVFMDIGKVRENFDEDRKLR